MGLILELEAAETGDGDEPAFHFGELAEVAPEFFELGDGEDVFLAVTPAFLHFLEGDVGGEAGGELADALTQGFLGLGGALFGGEHGVAGGAEHGEETVQVDPSGHGVVVGEPELVGFVGQGEAFDETGLAVDAGETAAPILESTGNDLEGEAGFAGEVEAEEGGIGVTASGIDIVEQEVAEVGAEAEETGQGAVTDEVGDFEEVADGVETLEGQVVGVIGSFADGGGPADEGVTETFADLLLLLVEHLLRGFLPLEAEVAFGGDEPQADGAAGGEEDGAGVVVVLDVAEEVLDGFVGEVAGGEDVGKLEVRAAGLLIGLGEVKFEERAVATGEAGEGVKGFADAGALGPAGAGAGGEGDDSQFAALEGGETGGVGLAVGFGGEEPIGGGEEIGGFDVLDGGAGAETVLGETDTAFAEVAADAFVEGGVEAVGFEEGG